MDQAVPNFKIVWSNSGHVELSDNSAMASADNHVYDDYSFLHGNLSHSNANHTLYLLSANGNESSVSYSNEGSSGGGVAAPGPEAIVVPVLFSIIVALGSVGNLLVIIVVIINKDHFKNTTNLFILNLAAADLLFLVFCIPFHAVIYTVQHGWPFGQFMCKFVHLVQYSSMIASIFTLVAMSLDRYLAVGYPLRTKHMRTPKRAFYTVLAVWFLALVMAMPWPVFYTVRTYDVMQIQIAICADDWNTSGASRPTYFLFLFALGYAIPLITISILSIMMVKQLWVVEGYRCTGTRTIESIRAKRKVTRLVIVIVVVFLVCWLPSHMIWLWTNYFPGTWHHTYSFFYLRIGAHALSYANSAMNPVIYAFLSQNFRNGFKRALQCKKRMLVVRTSPFPTRSYSNQSAADEHALPLSSFGTYS